MKNSINCPKCDTSTIIKIPTKASSIGKWNNAVIWSGLKHVDVSRYLCGSCGFSEEWIDNKEDIDLLANKYS